MTNPHSQSNFKVTRRINNSHTLFNNNLTFKGKTRTQSIRSMRRSIYPKSFRVLHANVDTGKAASCTVLVPDL